MKDDKKAAGITSARTTPTTRAAAAPLAAGATSTPRWVLTQGNNVNVIESADQPDSAHDAGERLIEIMGPFYIAEQAERYATRIRSRMPRAL